jgi:TonB family protein
MITTMNRSACLFIMCLLLLAACQSSAPPPEPAPLSPPEAVSPAGVELSPIGTVRVTASRLNVRSGPSASDDVIGAASRGERLALLERGTKGWVRVALASGQTGWVSAQYAKEVRNCPADREFRIIEPPALSFHENGAHGRVTVEATVGADGTVASTRLIRNETGDPALAASAEREIRSARFEPPVRNCLPKRFIYTYDRTF